jgi:hypothetical protein
MGIRAANTSSLRVYERGRRTSGGSAHKHKEIDQVIYASQLKYSVMEGGSCTIERCFTGHYRVVICRVRMCYKLIYACKPDTWGITTLVEGRLDFICTRVRCLTSVAIDIFSFG